jgi:hypothetical protein
MVVMMDVLLYRRSSFVKPWIIEEWIVMSW